MKKYLFFSLLCLVFILFTNTTKAQSSAPEGCCFYLEQINDAQIISPFNNPDYERYSLNPIVPRLNDGLYGEPDKKVEYYLFRFQNCPDSGNVKLSIDWKFFLEGQEWHNPLNATPSSILNRMNVEIEWKLPLISGDNWQSSGTLRTGMGLKSNANPIYAIVNGVNQAIVTDFPGQIDATPYGALFGYFNPYNNQNRWYNYFNAEFLEWLCKKGGLRIKITRYTTEDVKIYFRLMERKGGSEFQEYYDSSEQHKYMGGHGADTVKEYSGFWLEEQTYSSSPKDTTVCSGEPIPFEIAPGVFQDTIRITMIPAGPDTIRLVTPSGSGASTCDDVNFVDEVVVTTLIWLPKPTSPVQEIKDTVCGPQMVTLTATQPYEDTYDGDFVYKWYLDRNCRILLHTGKEFTIPCLIPNMTYYLYVTVTVDDGCPSDPERFSVHVYRQVRAQLMDTEECPIDGPDTYCKTVNVTNGYRDYKYEWSGHAYMEDTNTETGCINLTDEYFDDVDHTTCGDEFTFTVTVTDLRSKCTATATAITTIAEPDDDVTFTVDDITIYMDRNCEYDKDPDHIDFEGYDGKPYDIEFQCMESYSSDLLDISHKDVHKKKLDCATTGAKYEITRIWTVKTLCENETSHKQTITVKDTIAPKRLDDLEPVSIKTEYAEGCVTVFPTDLENELYELFDFTDNCTAEENIQIIILNSHKKRITPGKQVICDDIDEYTVIAIDECGNKSKFTGILVFELPDPIELHPSLEGDTIQCYGGTATVFVQVINAAEPYTLYYQKQGDAGSTPFPIYEPTEDIDYGTVELPAGKYKFMIEDGNGCTDTIKYKVHEPELLEIDVTVTGMIGCTGGEATLLVSAIGGTGDYEFSYKSKEAKKEIPIPATGIVNLTAGKYKFYVEDEHGCKDSVKFEVEQPREITLKAEILEEDSVLCYDEFAKITLTADGGTPPYIYQFFDINKIPEPGYVNLPGNTKYLQANKDDDEYLFRVIDKNGCDTVAKITVEEPDELEVTIDITPIICWGDLATVTIHVEGGTKPYRLVVDDATMPAEDAPTFTSDTILKLPAKLTVPPVYAFYIYDSNNCDAEVIYRSISTPDSLILKAEILDEDSILCFGQNATITLSATGGNGGYSYFYQGEEINSKIEKPARHKPYIFTVEDIKGCEASTKIKVTQPDTLTLKAKILPSDSIFCYGGLATIKLRADGGTGDKEIYYIDEEEGEHHVGTDKGTIDLPAGTHKFIVIDENECETIINYEVTEPDTLTLTAVIDSIQCNGDLATITLTADGGRGGYTYWYYHHHHHRTEITDGNIGTIDLPARPEPYRFSVKDDKCETFLSVTIDEPSLLTLDADIRAGDEVKCKGELAKITLTAAGGTEPYVYYYHGVALDGDTIKLPARHKPYRFIVIDDKGCEETAYIKVTEPELLTLDAKIILPTDSVQCFGGTAKVTLTANGGTADYTYTCLEHTGITPDGLIATINLPASDQCYHFLVTDSKGCIARDHITVTEPDSLILVAKIDPTDSIFCYGNDAKITFIVEGGTEPYTYEYYNDATNNYVNVTSDEFKLLPARPTAYKFKVTDDNGCTDSAYILVTQPDSLKLSATITEVISCHGDSALITLSASGGTGLGTYTYEYEGIALSGNSIRLSAANYINKLGVRDTNDCVTTIPSFLITEPDTLELYSSAYKYVICKGDSTAISLTVPPASAGVAPYKYYLGDDEINISNPIKLPAGDYVFTIIDKNDCSDTTQISIANYPDIEFLEFKAAKECDSIYFTVSGKISESADIVIIGYDKATNTPIYTSSSIPVTASPLTFKLEVLVSELDYTPDFIYFVAKASGNPLTNPCDYLSDRSDSINYAKIPMLHVYETSMHDIGYDWDKNIMGEKPANIILTGQEIKHYFQVEDVCKTQKDMHLSVKYKYFYESDEARPITDYLHTPTSGIMGMHYSTPMGDCMATTAVSYNRVSDEDAFPYQGSSASSGWYYDGSNFDFHKLVFLDEREITVRLSGFDLAGTYTIEYQLVTRTRVPGGLPYGNVFGGILCNPVVTVGGNGFYAPGSFIETVLSTRTMTIIVTCVDCDDDDDDDDDYVTPPSSPAPPAPPAATIYPNPTNTDVINIQFENIEGDALVRITSIGGTILLTQPINIAGSDVTINLPDLKPGIYFVNIISKEATITRKLVITSK